MQNYCSKTGPTHTSHNSHPVHGLYLPSCIVVVGIRKTRETWFWHQCWRIARDIMLVVLAPTINGSDAYGPTPTDHYKPDSQDGVNTSETESETLPRANWCQIWLIWYHLGAAKSISNRSAMAYNCLILKELMLHTYHTAQNLAGHETWAILSAFVL